MFRQYIIRRESGRDHLYLAICSAHTVPSPSERPAMITASTPPTANNHIETHNSEGGGDTPSAYPEIPSSEQIVGAESGMIKPPERPDD